MSAPFGGSDGLPPGLTVTPSGDPNEPIAIVFVDPAGVALARVTLSLTKAVLVVAVLRAAVDAILRAESADRLEVDESDLDGTGEVH